MIEIELDGKKVSVASGSMVMHAADAAGVVREGQAVEVLRDRLARHLEDHAEGAVY